MTRLQTHTKTGDNSDIFETSKFIICVNVMSQQFTSIDKYLIQPWYMCRMPQFRLNPIYRHKSFHIVSLNLATNKRNEFFNIRFTRFTKHMCSWRIRFDRLQNGTRTRKITISALISQAAVPYLFNNMPEQAQSRKQPATTTKPPHTQTAQLRAYSSRFSHLESE